MSILNTLPRHERNPVKDLWDKYTNREITIEGLDVEVKRRCIDNLNKWYCPQVVITTGLATETEKWLLRSFINHNMTMAMWLYECLKYSGLSKGQVLAKIDQYKQTVYQQQERLRSLSGKV